MGSLRGQRSSKNKPKIVTADSEKPQLVSVRKRGTILEPFTNLPRRRTVVKSLFAALLGLTLMLASGSVPRVEASSQTVMTAAGYMVYYKKPSWRSWKCKGPYSYLKACRVADDLEAQGCQTCVKQAR
jgi:hypothetical protein